jgi:G3E family GTPase
MKTYGMEIGDVLNKIDVMNKELGEVRKELSTLNERTKIMLKHTARADRRDNQDLG